MRPPRRFSSGVTLIELMVAFTVLAILLRMAVPSFTEMLAVKQLNGTMAQLMADLQYARAETAARNTPLKVTFSGTGYTVSQDPDGDGTWEDLRVAALTNGITVSEGSGTVILYNPRRGTAEITPSGSEITLSKITSAATHALKVAVLVTGRPQCTLVSGNAKC